MIDLYTWFTPNGRKISIMLEEIGLDYEVHAINIGKGEQHDPKFLEISPNNKIMIVIHKHFIRPPLIIVGPHSGAFGLVHCVNAQDRGSLWLFLFIQGA